MARLISILIWQAANEAQTTEDWHDKDRHSSRKSCATHSFQCVQYFRVSKQWIPMFGIVNLRTHVDACDCIQGLNGCRKRVCTESWLWEKNPLPHRHSNPRQYSAWPFSRTLYPLSHRAPLSENKSRSFAFDSFLRRRNPSDSKPAGREWRREDGWSWADGTSYRQWLLEARIDLTEAVQSELEKKTMFPSSSFAWL